MQSDRDSIDKIKNAAEDGEVSLTAFEQRFLDSIEERLDDGRELTGPQRETLGEIQEKVPPW